MGAALKDFGLDKIVNEPLHTSLAKFVRERFNEAEQHRRETGIEDRLLRNLRANKCEYQPDEKGLLGPYNDVYIGIPALKARAAESWIKDIILNNIEKPWTLDPTPIPDLPEKAREAAIDLLLKEIPMMGGVEALKDRARGLKLVYNNIAREEASRATKRMEQLIEDQHAEGHWVHAFGQFICELTVYPTAFMRGPIDIQQPYAKWDGDEYKVSVGTIPVSRCVSAFDAYPSKTSTNTQDGEFFIEKAAFAHGDIHALINVQGFNEGNVRKALADYSDGFDLNLFAAAERDRLENKNQGGAIGHRNVLETIIYNGKILGAKLAEEGVIVKDPQASYECEIWVLGDYTLRAILNPDPLGKRPVDSTSFRKLPGSPWGQSTLDLAYEPGRICNAQARALVRNMSYSSGPIGEVTAERVADTQDPTHIEPYKVVLVGPDMTGSGAAAYRFHNVGSIADQLLQVFERYMKVADDLTGVPSYVLGNPSVAGAGRTMGGLAMLMGNAAKGIKNVQLNIDLDVLAPHVRRYFVRNMKVSKDDSIKADARVLARGAMGLLQRELSQTRTVEMLQLLAPYIEKWEQLPKGIKIMLREVFKNTGLPVDDIIPDPDKEEGVRDIVGLLGGKQMVASNRGTSSPVPLGPQSIPNLGMPLSPRTPAVIGMPQGA